MPNLIKNPLKLLAVCYVVYMAQHSFAVLLFLLGGGFVYLKHHLASKARAEREVEQAEGDSSAHSEHRPAQSTVSSTPDNVRPIRKQYAKSAAVVDLKNGTKD
ncbi:hypothetical protein JOE11_004930 [Robbsia andropogonis]|uniref:hypothetical protein n=1 Tax=Robbsia andropogonis TaxID=28092 RepID=UPI0020A09AB4|nr:hypothetical protein [Robbsia andropogonis]MCP1121017.1 hypothetical protein [Robbsia andropogonis]MCP1130802.1 hypothetical protein [Robbsia andropogonis]